MKIVIRKQREAKKPQKWWMIKKVWPPIATIELPFDIRDENSLVKLIRNNYGPGVYSIIGYSKGKKGFKSIFRGIIEEERYKRESGKLSLFLEGDQPNVWHRIM